MRKTDLARCISVLLFMTAPLGAFAQEQSQGESQQGPKDADASLRNAATLDTIVVTSQRREQNAQDVPLAVTAISEETISRMQLNSTTDLIRMVPNMSGGEGSGSGSNQYSLRGLYNSESAATFDSPVGTYVDGIFLARMSANNFALFDVERIEVLRGPQGTLFGRNTTGGAINIVLKKPSESFGGYAEVGVGNHGYWQARGGVDIPVSERLRTRFAAYQMDEEGWVENRAVGGHNNGHSGKGARASLSWDVSDSVVWDISADYIDDSNANIPSVKSGSRWISSSGLQALGNLTVGRKARIPGNFVGNETWGLTSLLEFSTRAGQLQFISGYRDLTTQYNIDYYDNPLPIGGYAVNQYSTHKQFTQEAKLTGFAFDKLDYTVGAYYFNEKNDTDATSSFTLGSGAPFIETDARYFNDTESIAVYGQLDYQLTDRLTLTGGVRWTRDHKDIHFVDNGNPIAIATLTDQILIDGGIPLVQKESVVTPRAALQFKVSDDVMLFASATKGFKSGGWNVRGSSIGTLRDFGPETIWSYEAGIRSDWLDRRLRVNLTTFYGDTEDLQIASAFVPSGAGSPSFPVGNYSGFQSYGAELEVQVVPTDRLKLVAALGYNHTDYVDISNSVLAQQQNCLQSIGDNTPTRPNCGAGIITVDGRIAEPARAPKLTGTLSATYTIPLGNNWDLVPSVSVRHSGEYNTSATGLAAADQKAFNQIAAGLSFERADGLLSFNLGCNNCNNETYLLSLIGGHTWWSEPRRWTASARMNF